MSDHDSVEERPRILRRDMVRGSLAATVGLALGCGAPSAAEDAGAIGSDGGLPLDGEAPQDSGPPDAGVEPVDPPEGVVEIPGDFVLGVASGDATSSSAVLWTAYSGDAPLTVAVWEMEGETYARTKFSGEVAPVDGFVHLGVGDLSPGRYHRFCFFQMNGATRIGRSAIGRFRTAIASDAMEPLLLGAVSCTSNGRSFDTVGHAGARADLDLFIYVGDTTYNDGSETLEQYRAKWAENLSTAEYRSLRAATSALATWDDHEVDNNFDPESIDPDQLEAAYRSFFEHQPLRRHATEPHRIWKSVRWGLTAEIFVLDGRGERRRSMEQYVSRAQMDWLKAGLSASPAVFKIIVNSVPITDFPLLFDAAANDRWEGYPAQRQEILSHIDDNGISGVLWLSGDFHLASAQRVSTSGAGANQVELLAGPGAQTGNPLALTLRGPQFDFGSTTNNYTVLALDPTTSTVEARWIDGDGDAFQTRSYTL